MIKILSITLILFFSFLSTSFSAKDIKDFEKIDLSKDQKPGRFFEDQPDITDEHQIHFIYLLPSDGEDRELDINGKMQDILEKANNAMFEATKANKGSGGEGKKFRYDYREDGKLDITFIRTSKSWKELKDNSVNTQMGHYFHQFGGFTNKKKTYFLWTDVNAGNHGGDAGVGIGGIFVRSNGHSNEERLTQINIHELFHTQLMGIRCIKGIKKIHYSDHGSGGPGESHMLSVGFKLNRNLYTHDIEGCPQLIDSVYLTPTSNDPYNPYEIMCERNLGKYTHPKLVKIMSKAEKSNKWYKNRIGPTCNWRNWTNKFDWFGPMN
ncbi:hypothetical protein OAN79_02085 [Candidatus Pelagibacter sp.]|nr:hypothetical protein [Candidatus Pelagibacter sp.]